MINIFKIPTLLGIFFLILLLSSCKEEVADDDEVEIETISKPILNINEFQSLVIINDENENSPDSTESNLYGVNTDNELQKIGFSLQKEPNKSTPTYKIVAENIYNVNEEYIFISGYFESWTTENQEVVLQAILLNKNSGDFFDMSEHPVLLNATLSGDRVFQEDENGYLYFKSKTPERDVVKKLEIIDSESIEVTALNSNYHRTRTFEIDSKGNCFFYFNDEQQGDDFSREYKVITTAGNLLDLDIENKFNRQSWIGSDGDFYLTTEHQKDGPQEWAIHKVIVENGQLKIDSLWEKEYSSIEAKGITTMSRTEDNYYTMRLGGKVYFLVKNKQFGDQLTRPFFNFEEQTSELLKLNDLYADISQDAQIGYNTNSYYINNLDRLLKVRFQSNEIIEILPKNKYNINEFSVSNDNRVFVCAKRNSDNKNVLIRIENNNEVVIDESETNTYDYVFSLNQYLY